MTTLERPPAAAAPLPNTRLAPLARYATVLSVAGGVLTLVGALLPWATFVLNEGPYPEKATLEFFSAPFAVTGFLGYAPPAEEPVPESDDGDQPWIVPLAVAGGALAVGALFLRMRAGPR